MNIERGTWVLETLRKVAWNVTRRRTFARFRLGVPLLSPLLPLLLAPVPASAQATTLTSPPAPPQGTQAPLFSATHACDPVLCPGARTILEMQLERAQWHQRHVHPSLGGGITNLVLATGFFIAGARVPRAIEDRVCDDIDTIGDVQVLDVDCSRAADVTSYVLFGTGALVATVGSIKIVVHSFHRANARRNLRRAERNLEEFDRAHGLQLEPQFAVRPGGAFFGVRLSGSFSTPG